MVKLTARSFLSKLAKVKHGSGAEQPKHKLVSDLPKEETGVESPSMEKSKETKRIKIPTESITTGITRKDILESLRNVNESYPLISTQVNSEIRHLSHTNIFYNPDRHQLEYFVVEPQASEYLKKIIDRTKEELHERLDIDLSQLKVRSEVYNYINSKIDSIWEQIGLKLSPEDIIIVKYYIFRDAVGLNEIEPLMQDPNIEDIGCDGIGSPIFVFHRNPLYGEIQTNIKFDSKNDLDSFVMKLAQKCGRTLSVASPLMDGTLQDNSRVQITYGTDIARKGSNFTIRKFFRVPLTPIDLMNFGTVDAMSLAYIWLAIEKERSILISGSTASGKTTMLNAISLFIPSTAKIVSIEDTSELHLTHTNWIPQITRASIGKDEYGEIDMYTLLKSALRQRPDYLIVGEVRGREASVLFQSMATGHPSMCTLHADNVEAVIHRLTTRPIDLPVALLENLDVIIFLEKVKKEGKFTRRVGDVIEIEGFDYKKDDLLRNKVFFWIPKEDKFMSSHSSMLSEIAEKLGWSEQEIQEEISNRAKILTWMKDRGIYKFEDVSKVIQMYYADPRQLEELMNK